MDAGGADDATLMLGIAVGDEARVPTGLACEDGSTQGFSGSAGELAVCIGVDAPHPATSKEISAAASGRVISF